MLHVASTHALIHKYQTNTDKTESDARMMSRTQSITQYIYNTSKQIRFYFHFVILNSKLMAIARFCLDHIRMLSLDRALLLCHDHSPPSCFLHLCFISYLRFLGFLNISWLPFVHTIFEYLICHSSFTGNFIHTGFRA